MQRQSPLWFVIYSNTSEDGETETKLTEYQKRLRRLLFPLLCCCSLVPRDTYSSNYSIRPPELIFYPNNMPMNIEHIPKFEHDNNLSITVFHYRENGLLTTCYWRKRRENVRKKINLVLLTNAETSHYCLITNFQNFMHKMCRSYKKSVKRNKTKFCANCMQSVLKKKVNDHTRVCSENTPLRNEMSSLRKRN